MSISHLVSPIAVVTVLSVALAPLAVRPAAVPADVHRLVLTGECLVITILVPGKTDTITICSPAARRGRQISRW